MAFRIKLQCVFVRKIQMNAFGCSQYMQFNITLAETLMTIPENYVTKKKK